MASNVSRRDFLKESGMLSAAAAMGVAGAAELARAADRSAKPEPAMPTIKLGDVEVSRLILGSNPFWGYAHGNPQGSGGEMKAYYTDDRIVEVMEDAGRNGVTAVVCPPSKRWHALWKRYRDGGGKVRTYIAQPHGKIENMKDEISGAVDGGATAAFVQGHRTENAFADGRAEVVRGLVEHMKKLGIAAGLAAHRPDVHPEAERLGFPTDFYFQCFFIPDTYRPEDREKAIATIRSIKKPMVGYKVLAAGRLPPKEAFAYALKRLAKKDGICVGVYPKDDPDQVEEDARLARAGAEGPGLA